MTVGDSSDSSDPEVKASRNKGIMTPGHDDSSDSSDPKVITSHNKGADSGSESSNSHVQSANGAEPYLVGRLRD